MARKHQTERAERFAAALSDALKDELGRLLDPLIARAVAEASDPDPLIELRAEQWPLRRILKAAREGRIAVSCFGGRYYVRRDALYELVEGSPVPRSAARPAEPEPEMDHIDRLLARGGLRRKRP